MRRPDPRELPGLPLKVLRFCWRVLRRFFHNRGLLLAGAVGYNALLSLVPFLAITAAALSLVVSEQDLLRAVEAELKVLVPARTEVVLEVVRQFLGARDAVGVVGAAVMVFFSTIAFRILEDAFTEIFGQNRDKNRRMWVSLLLPYAFVTVLVLALLGVSLLVAAVDALAAHDLTIAGRPFSLAAPSALLLRVIGYLSMVALFSAVYRIIPPWRISLRRALAGGVSAAALWALFGQVAMYYFNNISLVGVIYGSLATVVVVLLSMELAAAILLLGAQVIAEIERSARAGLPWHQEPDAGSGRPDPKEAA